MLTPVARAPKQQVARLLVNGLGRLAGQVTLSAAQVNGHPGMIIRFGDEIDTVVTLCVENGSVSGLYAVRNPEKLSHMAGETALCR